MISLSASWGSGLVSYERRIKIWLGPHLDILPSEVWNLLCEPPRVINRTWWHLVRSDNPICQSNSIVILAKGGCLVHDASTAVAGDIGVNKNTEGPVFILKVWFL